ncbi:type I-C CRISPR-associated protein Cas5c [Alicyclobacillus mali (ex Roth et al. 2021)]|uniref:type I-C CRISPR-associated protein Cas5c n=1 Tax=Alicyclobacillus mali (ex Roth et al. 2021) TaxID=1123961 RepID=UPI003242795B
MLSNPPLKVKVWSELACFTRPEMKVERVTYPVMTPSAARGILEAILWKPEFSWRVREIHILRSIEYCSIVRNEVKNRMVRLDGDFFADDYRTQRHTLALKNPAYIIVADIVLRSHATDDVAKYRDMFRRRVQKGQCFHRPYLGCREFSAFFAEPEEQDVPQPISFDIGTMLFDIHYAADRSSRNVPIFFDAVVRDGILSVPQELYDKVDVTCS